MVKYKYCKIREESEPIFHHLYAYAYINYNYQFVVVNILQLGHRVASVLLSSLQLICKQAITSQNVLKCLIKPLHR